MAQSANVPKFGNWESQEDVPYTAYFDKARKVRTSGASRPKPEQEEPIKTSPETNNKRQGRSTYASGDENNSYERSPLHHQSRTPGRTVGAPSPLWDGTKNSYDGTARSKPRSNTKGDESPDKGTVVPKFGDWDKNDSSSADGYTHIFNKVREERNYVGAGTVSARTPSHPSIKPSSDSTKCCCFTWGGK